jgi:hypothetical protein
MRLLGRWAWWAPSPLSALTRRLGFSHIETDYECDTPSPDSKTGPAPRTAAGRGASPVRPTPGSAAG